MLVEKVQMLVGLFSTHCYFRVFPANTFVAVTYMNNKSVFMALLFEFISDRILSHVERDDVRCDARHLRLARAQPGANVSKLLFASLM
jgi:hypothetical protein